MPNKKRQPFYFFMLDVQKKHAERGKRYSLREMPAIASPLWANMGSAEKKKYEEMAKCFNKQESASGSVKTCHGVDFEELEREQKVEASKEKMMKEDVRQIIQQALLKNDLARKNFYLIHINYFCKSNGGNSQARYDAAELAILEFSLQDGLGRGMHTIMKLDSIPYGYMYEAKTHTSATHDLPLPPDTIGSVRIREAIVEAIKFVNCNDSDICSPIYTFDDHIPVVQSVFREVMESLRTSAPIDFRIYSLSELLFHLKKATHEHAVTTATSPPFASVFLAESYLERGTFDYAEGLPCETHVANDRVPYCSQTKIRGWAYSIIRSCAPDLGIQFVEGKHEPECALPTPQVKIPDEASDFTATEFSDRYSNYRPMVGGSSGNPSTTLNATLDTTVESIATSYNEEFPLVRDFKRGKGRGKLL